MFKINFDKTLIKKYLNSCAKTGKYSKIFHPKKAQKFNFHAKNPDLPKNHLKNVQIFNFDTTKL